jgi:hypothetical protein
MRLQRRGRSVPQHAKIAHGEAWQQLFNDADKPLELNEKFSI